MRGITAAFQFLIIIMILTSIATLFWFFASGTIEELTTSGTERTERTREILSSCMIVESVYENKIFIKNCGEGIIVNDSLNVYLDDEPLEFNMTPETVRKGEIGTITADILGLGRGDHDIKISNPSLQIIQKVEAILPDSAVLVLDFDEGSGTMAYDKSGYRNDGTLINMEPEDWVNGKFGKALEFDGTNEYVEILDSESLHYTEFTSCALFKLNSYINYASIVSRNRPHLMRFCERPGDMYTYVYYNDVIYNNTKWDTNLELNKWYYACFSFKRPTFYFYINDNLFGNGAFDYDLMQDFGPVTVGGIWDHYFNGVIDSVRIYNKALTPEEIFVLKMK